MRKFAMLAAVAALSSAAVAKAADRLAPTKVEGYVTIEATAAAAGIGYTWGDGVLRYHGHTYHFDVKGLSVLDVGYSKIVGHGRVYNIKQLADFSGTYGAATGEATIANGVSGQYLKNGNGVELRIDSVTKGARLAGAAGGIELTLRQ